MKLKVYCTFVGNLATDPETTARRNLLDNLDAKYLRYFRYLTLGQALNLVPINTHSPRVLDVANAQGQVILYLQSVMHTQLLTSHKFADNYIRRGV